ncbi:uncharacterized protein BJX67DRAFT_379744 [Aspergillus lucknowensis]|uniref:Uncharacterized protein n=1 Tax=Aspergillus lucknowensis TaxID=176173 RepID=A0ABR4LWF5_9EURO
MESNDTHFQSPPPSYHDAIQVECSNVPLQPTSLLLEGQSIRDELSRACLYQLSRTVTALPRITPKNSSVIFERVEYEAPARSETSKNHEAQPKHRHLFYLAHPADAQYRSDIPAYYITSMDAETLGNIHFETSKPRLQKTEFRALLSAHRTASHKPLFDEARKLTILFDARPMNWVSSRYSWTDGNGHQVAFEEGKGEHEQHKLVITHPMAQETRDALVALWVLRLWYETAESKQAKREELERMMPPASYQDLKLGKRVGALGALGGAGGG